MIKTIQLFGILCFFSSALVAGTVVEIQNNNELTTAITDGQKVRMNMSASEYVILDSSDHSIKIVDQQKQQVTYINASELATGSHTATVQTSVTPQGPGQVVAGYNTQKFSYSANGKDCGVLYGSQNAYQAEGVKQLLAAMKIMMEKQRAALGGFASLVDACTLADMQLIDFTNTVGLLMRTEKNGGVEIEVRNIKTGVTLTDDTFVSPASYKTVNMSGRVIADPKNIVAADQVDMQTQEQQQDYQHPQLPVQGRIRQMQQPARGYPQTMQPVYRMPRMMRQY